MLFNFHSAVLLLGYHSDGLRCGSDCIADNKSITRHCGTMLVLVVEVVVSMLGVSIMVDPEVVVSPSVSFIIFLSGPW